MAVEKYTIEVTDESVEIRGTLTIREAFDFLNFFEMEGYTTLEDWGDRTTLYLRKRDLEKELTERVNKETIYQLDFIKLAYEEEKLKSEYSGKKVKELESLIKQLMQEHTDKVKNMSKKIDDFERVMRTEKILKSQEALEIVNSLFPDEQNNKD